MLVGWVLLAYCGGCLADWFLVGVFVVLLLWLGLQIWWAWGCWVVYVVLFMWFWFSYPFVVYWFSVWALVLVGGYLRLVAAVAVYLFSLLWPVWVCLVVVIVVACVTFTTFCGWCLQCLCLIVLF